MSVCVFILETFLIFLHAAYMHVVRIKSCLILGRVMVNITEKVRLSTASGVFTFEIART